MSTEAPHSALLFAVLQNSPVHEIFRLAQSAGQLEKDQALEEASYYGGYA